MNKITFKILRWSCLALILLASLLLLLSVNLGARERLILGRLGWEKGQGGAVVTILTDSDDSFETKLEIKNSFFLKSQLEKYPHDQEFLIILRRLGGNLTFEKIYPLELPPEELSGPHWDTYPNLSVVLGTKPQLVEMIGLNARNYKLSQPLWFREHFARTNKVGWQQGRDEAFLAMLSGEYPEFVPNLWLVDGQDRVVNVRKIGQTLWTWPVFLNRVALSLFILALLPGGLAFVYYRFPKVVEVWVKAMAKLPLGKKQKENQQEAL